MRSSVLARPAESGLRRALRLPHATAMVVGIIIGASIFVQPSEITRAVPSIPAVFAAWVAAGLLTLAGALICAELAAVFPRAGGVYEFLKQTLSPALGFLWGWAMFWSMHSGIIAAISVIFARYLDYFLPLGDGGIRAAAIALIALVSAINYFGVQHGGRVQAAFTILKVAAIALVVLAGFALGSRLPAHFVPSATTAELTLPAFAAAIGAGLFAFGGWHMVTYTAEEVMDPERTVPRALALGMLVVVLCYVALNAVYFYVLPLDQVAASTRVAADAADAVLGRGGGVVLSSLVLCSTFGAISGLILAGPRVYFSMARDGLLFRRFGAVHPRFGTPHRAIVLQALWSSALVATGTYRALFTRVIYTEWLFFALMAIGLMLLRRRPGYTPRYRVPALPLVALVFVVASLAVVANTVAAQPRDSALGLGMVALGLPVYWIWRRARQHADH